MREYVLALLIAAAATYLLTPLVRRGAIATRTMHAARTRDVHVVPTPLLGGVAMYGGLAAGLLVANQLTYLREAFPSPRTVPGLLLAGGLLVITGIIDDRWGMGAISKLAAQVAAGAILVWSQVVLSWVPEPSGGVFILPPQLGLTLTILLVVVTINAVNFIDGLDGLAAGIVAIAACSFLVYSYTLARVVGIHSQSVPALVAALLAGMCIGFLPYNFYPATIFMGDTGAMLLGLLLAYVPLSSTAMLDPSVLIHYSHTTVNRYPTILPRAAARRDPGDPVRRPADGGRAPDQGRDVAVHRGQEAPASPAAQRGSFTPAERADHVPVGGPVHRRCGVPVAGPHGSDRAGRADRGGRARAAPGHHAAAPPGPSPQPGAAAPAAPAAARCPPGPVPTPAARPGPAHGPPWPAPAVRPGRPRQRLPGSAARPSGSQAAPCLGGAGRRAAARMPRSGSVPGGPVPGGPVPGARRAIRRGPAGPGVPLPAPRRAPPPRPQG